MASDTGLIRSDRRSNTTKYFINDPKDAGSISSNLVVSVYQDRRGNLWAGTDQGLNLYNKQTNKFTRYQRNANNNKSISNMGYYQCLRTGREYFGLQQMEV